MAGSVSFRLCAAECSAADSGRRTTTPSTDSGRHATACAQDREWRRGCRTAARRASWDQGGAFAASRTSGVAGRGPLRRACHSLI
jgi:hypothetical protein